MDRRKTLYLIDGPNIAFRAHYAIRGGLSNSRGEPTSALFGFCSMLFKLLAEERPDHLAIVWDPKGDVFRNALYPDYKGTRPDMPDELRSQMPRFPDLARALGIPFLVVPDFEADDVIGTLARAYEAECDVVIVTSDKDMMQLVVKDRISILDTMKDLRIGPAEVQERWGVPPERIIDILALMGDSSDNIPGVRGIGEKGAAQLIETWGGVEEVFAHADEVSGRNRKPLQAEGALESARLSYALATIKTDVPLDVTLQDLALHWPPRNRAPVEALFAELEFHRFLSELGGAMEAAPTSSFTLVTDLPGLRALVEALLAAPLISVDTETTSKDPMRADLVGLSFCVDDGGAWYVPVGHVGPGCERQLPRDQVLLHLRSILESPKKRFLGQHLKYDRVVLLRHGVRLGPGGGDTLLGSFLLNPARASHKLDDLALTWLRQRMIAYDTVTAEVGGRFAEVPLEAARDYAAEDAHVVWRLHPLMQQSLQEQGLAALYDDVEVPLVQTLARMEATGIRLDEGLLRAYSVELAARIADAEQRCWAIAGQEFNTASPRQLEAILFDQLGLRVVKKTKTGRSTDASVLEELAAEHELPEAILHYRMLAKLKSTYVDPLPELVHPDTGRVHTTYHQTVAATGRLSSQDPNLQNIPIRTAEGRRIRQAFIAEPGFVLLSADYSQVELRVLAHLAGGQGGFARAFANGIDVHRATAAEVFGVARDAVTDDMRRTAKAINFGLVYGQTDFGLARSLHITRAQAADTIDRYKARYPEIEQFMEEAVEQARRTGFATTLLGRRRPVADLTSSNFNQRQQARRIAINTPVQGSAADIIKVAMLSVERALAASHPRVRMLLQVHDELVFEVPEAEVDPVKAIVVDHMENAVALRVPLRVDTGVGSNWDEAH